MCELFNEKKGGERDSFAFLMNGFGYPNKLTELQYPPSPSMLKSPSSVYI